MLHRLILNQSYIVFIKLFLLKKAKRTNNLSSTVGAYAIFSKISNLFDSNKPYALSTHNRKYASIFGEALRITVKKIKQNLTENYSNSTKIAITACNISKIFRRSMPPDPPRPFLVSQSASNLFCRKNTLKKCGNYAPPPFKISRSATASPLGAGPDAV